VSTVYTSASVSLDGYISGPDESGFDHLFAWYGNGDREVPTADPEMTFRMTEASAQRFQPMVEATGAVVVGRRLFDLSDGWSGRHPMGWPVVVLTHRPPEGWPGEGPEFTFVTGGIEQAVAAARDLAGERDIAVNGGSMTRQCLAAGLLDEIWVDLVPVLLGGGTPFFGALADAPVPLEGPTRVIEGSRVTHLHYRVRR
jgi:dihydrofolate reductase